MKFGQDYEAALQRDEFPRDWVDSAISYKKLKKCIKRVKKELLSLGLDQETLNALWQHVSTGGEASPSDLGADRILHYTVNGNSDKVAGFVPKLTIALDPHDGSPMDAWLSPDTRRYLRRFSRNSRGSLSEDPSPTPPRRRLTVSKRPPINGTDEDESQTKQSPNGENKTTDAKTNVDSEEELQFETVEIPLTSDSEFFQILRRELTSLESLQLKEQREITTSVSQLASQIRALKASKKSRSKKEIQIWRKLFELYVDSEVFLSSHEADAGSRDASHASKQLKYFSKTVAEQRANGTLTLKEGNDAMDNFLKINGDLLRLMRFQEMNRIALTKILKKFDKQTALHARAAIPELLKNGAVVSQDLAKATCYTITNELLSIIPQINDYLCPICFSVTYKPVRLECQHVFCIRCLIVMQRENQDHCPLCRADVVMKADAGMLPCPLHEPCAPSLEPVPHSMYLAY
jgi:E3 ubiquitin-protein ligase BAH